MAVSARTMLAADANRRRTDEMFDWRFPYASRRAPVLARNVVATSQPLAANAGLDMLRQGGNAVDAALAAAIALTVVEPCSNGVGSDAFALVWAGDELVGLNGSGRSPALWTPARFERQQRMPRHGWDAVTVPGAVSAWVALAKRFGRLPFAELFAPAIRYARAGFHVGHKTAAAWARAAETYAYFPDFLGHFLPAGRAPKPGEVFANPHLADTLEAIAATEGEALYRGALAERIDAAARAQGGALRLADLADHQADWVTPIRQPYRGTARPAADSSAPPIELAEIPPNGQGLAAQIALAILDHLGTHALPPGSAEWTHLQVEAMKIAIRAALDHIADPNAMRLPPAALLAPDAIRRAANSIGRDAAPLPPAALPASEDTVYLATADADGMMVSMIQSNYMGFGSGVVVPGTDIAMQNRGAGFVLEQGHPNQVGPRKRPYHTIIPGFVLRADEPLMSFGVMGGHMQHQGHVQMVTRIFDHGENPQAASDAPRWQVTPDFRVLLETGHAPEVARDLTARGHQVELAPEAGFGGAQLVCRLPDGGYCAASDHRKEGCAVGF